MKKYFIKSLVSLIVLGSAQVALAQAVPTLYVDSTEGSSVTSSKCLMLKAGTLKYGASDTATNGEVSSLQGFLISKGFLTGSPTGFYGKMTEDAVKAYQRSSGIDSTGNVGPLTRGTISNETCTFSYNTSEVSNEVTVCTAEYRVCADGSPMPQGPGCGWHPEQCPGRTPSGAITYGGSNLSIADEVAMNTGVAPSMAYASSQTPQVLGASTMCVNLSSNLHRGAESSSVTKLQKFLSSKGFLTAEPTGFYGDMTVEAVKLYQSSVGITSTGMVYDLTRQAIRQETCN